MGPRHAAGLLLLAALGPVGDDRPGQGGAAAPRRVEAPGIENAFRLGPRLWSGGRPEGDAAFAFLAARGVRTLISVDGARPDVEAARRHGLRYVHLPIGYDGVPPDRSARMLRAIELSPGPVFVHCHHGRHRGPAAVAVAARAVEGWSGDRARAWLESAGTDPHYVGLFRDVDRFEPPTREALDALSPDDLPEVADVTDLVGRMVEVDAVWDRLKAVQAAEARAPPVRTGLDPPHEARMLAESYREARRLGEGPGHGPGFDDEWAEAIAAAGDLEAALRADAPRAAPAFERVARSCRSCHGRFRDRRG